MKTDNEREELLHELIIDIPQHRWNSPELKNSFEYEIKKYEQPYIDRIKELEVKLKESVEAIDWYMHNTNPISDYQTFHDLGMNIRMTGEDLINKQ